MNDTLTNKYQNAKDLMTEMTSDLSDERLDCETILRERNEWVLNENEFNAKEEFEKVLSNSEYNCSNLIYFYSCTILVVIVVVIIFFYLPIF
jgi:hypothetical protein